MAPTGPLFPQRWMRVAGLVHSAFSFSFGVFLTPFLFISSFPFSALFPAPDQEISPFLLSLVKRGFPPPALYLWLLSTPILLFSPSSKIVAFPQEFAPGPPVGISPSPPPVDSESDES